MRCYLLNFQSCLLIQLCNFEFLQVIIAFFSKYLRPRNMKFGLHRVFIWVNLQKKFQVPRLHSIGRKMRCYLLNFQWCLLMQLCNFEILQVIIAFFSKCLQPRNMKFGLHRVFIWVNLQKKFQVPRLHSIGEKCVANL